jgi:hypothetical protein
MGACALSFSPAPTAGQPKRGRVVTLSLNKHTSRKSLLGTVRKKGAQPCPQDLGSAASELRLAALCLALLHPDLSQQAQQCPTATANVKHEAVPMRTGPVHDHLWVALDWRNAHSHTPPAPKDTVSEYSILARLLSCRFASFVCISVLSGFLLHFLQEYKVHETAPALPERLRLHNICQISFSLSPWRAVPSLSSNYL